MITIYIDGKPYQVEEGENLLRTCIKLGIDIPYFCYHPALGSVGACRLCAVKRYRDANDKNGRIVMSCMEPVSDGMMVSVNDEEVKNFRAAIIESLMTNHPHDCPICDEGGECHLQDMVVKTGHTYRRFEFKKRTFKNQYLGPYIHHEMNRCIQCYRCVRFYTDYAGGKDFGVTGAHNKLYFGRFEDGPFESIFSGNLVEVCPTGVFTDKTLRSHYTRKWDLTHAPSICNQCSAGCNIIFGERYGQVRRVLNRYNEAVNGFFICDRGRFNYEYINNKDTRITQSYVLGNPADSATVLNTLRNVIATNKVAAIGSSNSSVEANYLLQQLVGKENFYADVVAEDWEVLKTIKSILESNTVKVLSIKDIEKAEGVIVLGEDIYQTSPRLALAIRQSIRNKPLRKAQKINLPAWHANAVKTFIGHDRGPLFVAHTEANWLDEISEKTFRKNTSEIEQFAQAIVDHLEGKTLPQDTAQEVKYIIDALTDCRSVAIVSGTCLKSKKIVELSAKIASLLQSRNIESGIYYVVPKSNSMGMAILAEQSMDKLFGSSTPENIILLEPDLVFTDAIKSMLASCKNIIVLHHSRTAITEMANILVATGTIAESEGTLINAEGRMQRYFSVMPPQENVVAAWKWLSSLLGNNTFDEILIKISSDIPLLRRITEVAPDASYRVNGMKIPRQTPRFSGRTSMLAHKNVHEPKPVDDKNSPLSFSMEGTQKNSELGLMSFYLMPGWHSVQATNKLLRELDQVLNARSAGIRIWNS
ncbi:MAG: NADH-quinone oxidoreductase subunit NuoG [Bacteroidales bacterium]|nr:NADH-quinone oxidoreductase subunit NuoG [Bacteroidales bacterium]